MTTSDALALLSIAAAIVPWFVLLWSVVRRLIVGLELQTWQLETVVVGIIFALATRAAADTPIGWIAYGAALLAHGRASIGARVGTAYARLVALPGGDAHAVECLAVQRWYTWGAMALGGLAAILAGAWVAIVQLVVSELYARWRRAYLAGASEGAKERRRRAVTGRGLTMDEAVAHLRELADLEERAAASCLMAAAHERQEAESEQHDHAAAALRGAAADIERRMAGRTTTTTTKECP
jgi:hypothetical protein